MKYWVADQSYADDSDFDWANAVEIVAPSPDTAAEAAVETFYHGQPEAIDYSVIVGVSDSRCGRNAKIFSVSGEVSVTYIASEVVAP